MLDRDQAAELFVQHRELIEALAMRLGRRSAFPQTELEDFRGRVMERLIEDEYALIRAFREEARFATYLSVVLVNLLREYRVLRWGRWRPSNAARRLGSVAVRFEQLVHRDGHSWREAAALLRSLGLTDMTDRELGEIYAKLPRRLPIRPQDSPVQDADDPVVGRSVSGADGALRRDERKRLMVAFRAAIADLPAEDGLILRMRYWEERSIPEIAELLHLKAKPIYRRIEGIEKRLKDRLGAQGFTWDHLRELLDDDELDDDDDGG